MPRHRLKPELNIEEDIAQLLRAVSDYYGEAYDDRHGCSYDHVSLRQVARKFNITVFKARKILITAERYSIEQSRLVRKLQNEGKSIDEIMSITGLSKSSVNSYLPYSKTVYKLENKTVGADRTQRWRERM